MAKVHVDAGICGFHTDVEAVSEDGQMVTVTVKSACPHVMKFAEALAAEGELDAYGEIFSAYGKNKVTEAAVHLKHVVCIVPIGVLKAMEVACELALPKEASLRIEK